MGDLLLLNGDVSDIYSRDKEQHQVLVITLKQVYFCYRQHPYWIEKSLGEYTFLEH